MPQQRSLARRGLLHRYADRSRYLAPLVVAITVATTLITFFETGSELTDVKLLVTVCVGLLGLVLCLQLETLLAVAERNAARDEHGKLLAVVEEHPGLLRPITKITEAASKTIRETGVEEFREEVANVLADTFVSLEELTQGRLRSRGINGSLHARFGKATQCLQGTTDAGDTWWWTQESGVAFFALNKELIEAEVRIERLWLLAEPPDAQTTAIMAGHDAAGVYVYMVRTDQVEPQWLVNMTMADEVFLHEDIPNKTGYAIDYLYSENEVDLQRAIKRFGELKVHAVRYVGSQSIDHLWPKLDSGAT